MVVNVLMAGLGGFLGSICRYLISLFSIKYFTYTVFPLGTLIVNVAGCFLIGLLGGLAESREIFSPEVRILVLIGFLGGFTTYSTFGNEIFILGRNAQWLHAFANLSLHLVLGFAAVALGFLLSRA